MSINLENFATPGSWFATAQHVQSLGSGKDKGGYVCKVDGANATEMVANAQLIAAAPDMRDALIQIDALLEKGDPQTIADYMQHQVLPLLQKAMIVKGDYEVRIEQLELEGFTTSDAQGIADVEESKDELETKISTWFENHKEDFGLPDTPHDIRVKQLEFDGYSNQEAQSMAIQEEADGVMYYNIDEWNVNSATGANKGVDKDFAQNDELIFTTLKSMKEYDSNKLIELVLSRGYTGTDLSVVIDVINESFPEHELSVFDPKDPSLATAKSVGLLEQWCDKAYLMGLGGRNE